MRMLAHLKNFNFSALELNITWGHFLFRHNFDSNIFAGFFMNGRLNETKLTFTERFFDVIEVEKIAVADDFLDRIHPSLLVFLGEEVVTADLVGGEDQFEGIEDSCAI
jgi:hypothetical protein